MHWSVVSLECYIDANSKQRQAYRATLRRHGDWRRNLNMELLTPFTKNIAGSWSKLFETDLLRPFEVSIESAIRDLLNAMESSAAIGLKERVKMQGDLCLAEAEVALKQAVAVVRETLRAEQKEVSRCLAPHVQNNLVEGYELAMDERGKGSVARQKVGVFNSFVSNCLSLSSLFSSFSEPTLMQERMKCSMMGLM